MGWEVEPGDVLYGPAQIVGVLPQSLQVSCSKILLGSSEELCRFRGTPQDVSIDKGVHETSQRVWRRGTSGRLLAPWLGHYLTADLAWPPHPGTCRAAVDTPGLGRVLLFPGGALSSTRWPGLPTQVLSI